MTLNLGFIKTPMLASLTDDGARYEFLAKISPIGRLAEASEMANLVGFLLCDRSSYITGSCFEADGGYLCTSAIGFGTTTTI